MDPRVKPGGDGGGLLPLMHNPARILIVDDNETNRDILKTRLTVHGYDLLEAGDG